MQVLGTTAEGARTPDTRNLAMISQYVRKHPAADGSYDRTQPAQAGARAYTNHPQGLVRHTQRS